MQQIFIDRHSKGEFHVLVEELKLFDHEFFFWHIGTRHFDFSQRCFAVFVLFNNLLDSACIQQFHWLIILLNNLFHFGVGFISTAKRKQLRAQGKEIIVFLVGTLTQSQNFPFPRKKF